MFKKLLIGFILFLAIALVAIWIALPRIILPEAEKRLEALGFDSVTLSDLGLSLHGLTIGTASLKDNEQAILIKEMALQWDGLDPRNLNKLRIDSLTLPPIKTGETPAIDFNLNLSGNTDRQTSFTFPEITIKNLYMPMEISEKTYKLHAENTRIFKQDDGYQIYSNLPLDKNKTEQISNANGNIQLSAFYKNAQHFEAALNFEDVNFELAGETPVEINAMTGDIRYLTEPELPHPLLSVKIDIGSAIIDGAVFRLIQIDAEKLSETTYHILTQTDQEAPTKFNLSAIVNTQERTLQGEFDIISTDLSSAPQDYPQLANPELSGEFVSRFDFDITAPEIENITDAEKWTGRIDGDTSLDRVNYNEIKNIDSNINLQYNLQEQKLKTNFNFKSVIPSLDVAGDLSFENDSDSRTTAITGQIDKVAVDDFSARSNNAYATYDRNDQKLAFDLRESTITPTGAFSKYPSISGRLRGTFENPKLGFNFSGVESGGRLNIQTNGQYDTTNKNLDLTYTLLPERTLSAADITKIFPDLKQSLNEFSGKISVSGAGKLRNNSFTSNQKVKIEADSAIINSVEAIGIAGVIEVSTTPAIVIDKEEIFIGGLDVGGLPLKAGEIIFSFHSAKDLLSVHDMKWTLADGQLTTQPFTFNTKTRNADLLLQAKAIDLGPLFSYMPMEGLTASGHVSGEIPVSINNGKISVKQGHLESVDTGDLRYDPADPPAFLQQDNAYINMGRDALTDYNYKLTAARARIRKWF